MGDVYRLAVSEDADELLVLTTLAYEPIRQLGLKFPAASADIEFVRTNIARGSCYVVERDGKLISTASISQPENVRKVIDYPCELPFIWWVATDPQYGGQGIASQLLDWLEQTIVRDQMGAEAVALSTATKHPWLVSMYEHRGYQVFYRASDEPGSSVLMQKKLQKAEATQEIRA